MSSILRERAENFALALLRLGEKPAVIRLYLTRHLHVGYRAAEIALSRARKVLKFGSAALGLAFPLPCGDATICWQSWTPPKDATRIEIRSGGVTCATLPFAVGRKGVATVPGSWWPRSTDACPLSTDTVRWYSVRACNDYGCSAESEPIEWHGQPQAEIHMTATGPCEWGGSLTRLPRCP